MAAALRSFTPATGYGDVPIGDVTVVVDKDEWATDEARLGDLLDTFGGAPVVQAGFPWWWLLLAVPLLRDKRKADAV